ncbi:MAG: sodium ion-translocating decarboxylase subunit beta [Oscillospiraceae bacterium]|nr:sodium ion-translocating decarboxylase subunit beta [Oscillospiraceae bacterium]
MWAIGGALIYLAIARKMEPALLLPMGFGAILVNLPDSGAGAVLEHLFQLGIAGHELMPLMLFIGIGAMIDFEPLLANPKLMLFGAAAQFGILFTLCAAVLLGFALKDAASIAVIGAADGPTSIFVSQALGSNYTAAILVAAYSYMALVPLVQPPVIRLCTSEAERKIKMPLAKTGVSRPTKILFPILVTVVVGLAAPQAAALVGFLMFGNLIRVCGVLDSLSDTARNVLANLITIFLGLTISARMTAAEFLRPETWMILALGLVAFVMDTVGGVLAAKCMNLFLREKINPMLGAAGISAFPMAARTVNKLGLEADCTNHLLMHAVGVNVAGQIASVVAGGMILSLLS